MKKIFVLSLVASMFLFGCGPDDTTTDPDNGGGSTDKLAVTAVTKENKSLVVKYSGTNCPPCGTWGWAMMAELVDAVEGEAVAMTAYGQNFVAENYIISEATTLQNAWGATGYPHFGANGSVTSIDRGSGVNTTAEKDEIYQRVNDHKAADVVANTTLNYEIVDGKINMKYLSQAYSAVDAPYLAIYVLENKVKGYQSGHSEGNGALHKFVLRAEATGGKGYGSSIDGLNVGSTVSGEATLDIDSDWDESHLTIGVVMYNKVGTKYEFVNASLGNLVE
ncbi:MAG: hypothetical protein COA58_08240 [Bacteroidetes bacterium]|nr:MAG: hypothetical protein COA58_08240 [Bacteroidota bacterium]